MRAGGTVIADVHFRCRRLWDSQIRHAMSDHFTSATRRCSTRTTRFGSRLAGE